MPVRGKAVVLWLKLEGLQPLVVWQMEQSEGKPDATWFGLAAEEKSPLWQE